MTPAEKALAKHVVDGIMDGQASEDADIVRIIGVREDWHETPAGTVIGVDYTRIGKDTALLVKRRAEMTRVESIMALNKEFRTGQRVRDVEDDLRDILGVLYLEDVPATKEEVERRRAFIVIDKAIAKAAKG